MEAQSLSKCAFLLDLIIMNIKYQSLNSGMMVGMSASVQKKTSVPITLFTGYLGSGKTTIMLSLIQSLIDRGEKVAFIKNEIGEIDIDAQIMRGKNIQTKELLNGCICCTLVGPFNDALDELIETVSPDRILIEASGTSQPIALVLAIRSHKSVHRDGVITVIDCTTFTGFADLSVSARKQAECTDLFVLNKIELVDIEHRKSVVGYIRELNQYAPIVEAPHGVVDISLVFGIATHEVEEILRQAQMQKFPDHLHEDGVQTCAFSAVIGFSPEDIRQLLTALPKNVIRVKGFTNFNGQMYKIDKVGERSTIEPIQLEAEKTVEHMNTVIVCIGFALFTDECHLLDLFEQKGIQRA
jgi:G3E family GTPase